ncbi:sodium-coupled monocarboxylate transporter 1-like [Ischnura elegans]|uniref:sodium-coupled monocarboxylate transporter 1-like n=1 Tax=Ischnura elegans TaxID=197161 RepID=UPI001ED874D7|nr:sodium-coupled monocarboxylate transporter 1-like [Ischnura elegans]
MDTTSTTDSTTAWSTGGEDEDVALKHFAVLDYLVFAAMLVVSALVGVYFGFFAKTRQDTTSQYLMGGRSMGILPISMSLIASYISGIALLGLPAEIYTFGTQYWVIVFSEVFVCATMAIAYIPVFYDLKITSSYEYLKHRFNTSVRLLGSAIFITKMILYIPIVIYVPALAFSQVTGFNLHLITPIVCIVCIFYTTLGGLKAVVWTDTLQTAVMFGGVITILVVGTIQAGGVAEVWRRNQVTGRIEFFNFDLDPRVRHTFWNVTLGNYVSWLASCAVNQAMIQRCLAMSSLKKARAATMILAVGIMAIVSLSCYTGLVVYANFHGCDPLLRGAIKKPDQLLPYLVMDMSSTIPGLPGVFISGVFSAALSTMSTGLNSMTGVLYEDFIRPMSGWKHTEARASIVLKVAVVIIGCVCVTLVFLVEKLGTLIQASKSMAAITAGPLLGIFSLGLFFPWANSKGALAGGLVSMAMVSWISLGTQAAIAAGRITFPKKFTTTAECPVGSWPLDISAAPTTTNTLLWNATSAAEYLHSEEAYEKESPFFLYSISYLWYTAIGVIIVLSIGLTVSWATGFNDLEHMDPKLLSPVIRPLFPSVGKHFIRKKRAGVDQEDGTCTNLLRPPESIITNDKLLDGDPAKEIIKNPDSGI